MVVFPAIKGNAPQIPQPKKPNRNNLDNSCLYNRKFFLKKLREKGNNIKKHNNHLQKANEIGGTDSAAPRATTKLDAIKIG